MDGPLRRARDAFRAAFERESSIAAAAPGRVNLIGEHTDYNDGFVLPVAIDRWTVVVGAPASDPAVSRVVGVDLRQTHELDLRGTLRAEEHRHGHWASYVAGVAAGVQSLLGARSESPTPNLDLAVAGSVPIGSGLASSASLEVAVATLLEAAWGVTMSPREKALLCQRAEHEFAGVPCGLMDQFVSAMGRRDHALLIDCRAGEATAIPLPPPDRLAIVIANTNVHHALATGEYAARRSTCAGAARKLSVSSLRDATIAMVESRRGTLTPDELRAARHVVTENTRTLAAAEALREGDLGAMGQLMAASHASLRDDYHVSCPELDTLVDLAADTPGVWGARMTGGGFGGCAVVLCRPESVAPLTSALASGYRERHRRECSVFATTAVDGASHVEL